MKINLGSGQKRIPGFLNIDIDNNSKPDFILNLETDILPFEDNTIDGVIAHHILEHLGTGFFHCVKELYRVCKHNTTIDVRVPHPRHDTFLIDPTHKRPVFPHTLDMFSKERNRLDIANNGCETPIGLINDVDIRVINFMPVLDEYWQKEFQQMTEKQCDYAARTFNNVILEYQIQWVVFKDET